MRKVTLIQLCLLVICGNMVFAQTPEPCVINTSGGAYDGGSYSYEWSIGELALVNEMTDGNSKYIVTNGFLQPFVKKENASASPPMFTEHEFHVLNNPVKDVLRVQLISAERGKLTLWLYDERGYLQHQKQVTVPNGGTFAAINMMNFASANYILKAVFVGDVSQRKRAKSYSLVKIN